MRQEPKELGEPKELEEREEAEEAEELEELEEPEEARIRYVFARGNRRIGLPSCCRRAKSSTPAG